MNFKLTQTEREELVFTPFDSTRDIIEVDGVRQDMPGFHGMGLWMVLIEAAIRNKCMPCSGRESEFERLVAHLEEFRMERQDTCTIYRLTF